MQAQARKGLSRQISGDYDASLVLRPALPLLVLWRVRPMSDTQRRLLQVSCGGFHGGGGGGRRRGSAASLTNIGGAPRPKHESCNVKILETCERRRGKGATLDLRPMIFGLAS